MEPNQEEAQNDKPFTPMNERAPKSTWSWGAFMLDPFFIIAIKKYQFLFVYLLYFVPFINFLAMIGIKIYLGLYGRKMAEESTIFSNNDQFEGFMKAIDHAGKVVFYVSLALVILTMVAFGMIFSFAANQIGDFERDFERNFEQDIERSMDELVG